MREVRKSENRAIAVGLGEIESASLSSNAVLFEKYTGLNPFELTCEEVDNYRPAVNRFISDELDGISYRKAHDAYILNTKGEPLFPTEVSKKIVYFVRNPLDVCVSFANHSDGNIESKVNLLLNEKASIAGKRSGQLRQILFSWKGHVESWLNQSAIPIHFVRYEDMKRNPLNTFGSIIRFLELEYDEERLIRAIKHSDFKLLQQMEQQDGFKERSQLCKSFFWKGEIGNYRNLLSNEQISRIIEYNAETMKKFGYLSVNYQLTI